MLFFISQISMCWSSDREDLFFMKNVTGFIGVHVIPMSPRQKSSLHSNVNIEYSGKWIRKSYFFYPLCLCDFRMMVYIVCRSNQQFRVSADMWQIDYSLLNCCIFNVAADLGLHYLLWPLVGNPEFEFIYIYIQWFISYKLLVRIMVI